MIALPGIAIQDKIYESSNSLVYRGIRDDGVGIVVKMLKLDYPSPQELTRYRQEYKIISSLNLQGAVKAYSQQDYQRTLVILLEDFGAESLEQWMHKRPDIFYPMPLSIFLGLAIAICDILGRIHAANVIHKDINPGNIVLNLDTGVVKIIDFGIATQFNRTNPTFKSPHVLEGTLAYLSPEQTGRMNRLLDYRTDFYSLGVTFYELLTGHLPFPTTDILELVHCHIAKQPIPPHELNAAIPKAVSDIVLKLMAKNAEERYQSAWGIKADLEIVLRQFAQTDQIDHIQLGLQDVSDRFQIPQKLYGREAEIEALLAAFDRVAGMGNQEDFQFQVEMMLVSGYAGVGKSALVQELYQPITQKRGYFISGKFDQFGRNIPYSAIADALQKLVQQLLGEPDEQVQQWRSQLLTALGTNGQIIIDIIPEVELIIGKQPPVPEVGATEAENRFNLIFQKFVRVFCSESHPLVIFLDDLQWIDSATLKLIELMLLDEQTQFLFLIGAYRDNEVNQTHPLVLTLERLRKQGAVLEEIVLAPLTFEPLSQLIAETLHRDADTVCSLAQLVLRKTEGNPFFAGEFLRMLECENLLTFDVKSLSWQWNIAQIEAQNITDNVVELMLLKLKKLPENTQQILRLAACIGAEFDLDTLAIVCQQSPKAISLDLLVAIQAGLIQPISELDENLLVQEYKFLHDRVQQAAYTLIDESQKLGVHLQIGRNLLEKTLPEQLAERLFEIVDQLNYGTELITEESERNEIAKLNLQAGQKALAATAYEAAFKYCNTGLKLLEVESWQREYDLTLVLYSEAAEAAYLSGHFDEMERLVEEVLNCAKTVLDKVKAYDSRIQAWLSQGDPKEALKTGLEVLQLLGISLVEAPSQLDVQAGLEETASRLVGREIEDLIDLPEMTEPVPLAAIYILVSTVGAAFNVSPALMVLIVCKMVNLSIANGNATWSLLGYAAYGMMLCGVVQDIELGYRFGKLSLNLAKRLSNKKANCKALLMVNFHIIHWKDHLKETFPSLAEAYQSGIESGEFEFASYCAFSLCYYPFFAGQELTELEQQTAIYRKATNQIRRETASIWLAMLQQTILNLRGQSENPSRLVGCIYDEEQALSRPIAVKDGTSLHYFYLNKLILCYLFGEYEQAAKTATLAEQYLGAATAIISVPLFHFYDSLIFLSLLADASNSEKAACLNRVNANQEKMQKWAHHAPMNFLHKFQLVEAEKARVLGQFFEAEEFYEQAIFGAKENKYLQEEALSYELAAKHYLARGRERFAQLYMKEAHYCYERWGATAKAKDLETRYPQFFPQSLSVAGTPVHTTAGTTSNSSDIALDLAAVMKASQAISREIELDQLLNSLMQILIENAGAQTGCLILENAGEWAIEAACELNDGANFCTTQVLQSISMVNRLPESIIHYVIRTHESVILNDATREGNFINEPYIQQNQTKSLLCLPLLNQSKLVGVLYLENRLVSGAFTAERSQLLNLLSTQAAIAIENAKLYSELRASESRMTQFLEAIPLGVAVVDAAGRPYYFNQQATQLTGKGVVSSVTMDQLAETYQTYVAGTNQKYPTEKLNLYRALKGERTRTDDLEIHRGNTIIPVEIWGTPVFGKQGKVAYAIATFQDITERKQAEHLLANYNRTLEQQVVQRTAALQQSQAELREREQELRLITDALPVCITYVDADQRYRFVNRTYEEWFQRSRGEILGKHICDNLGEAAYQVAQPYINQVLAGQITTYEAEMPCVFGKKYISNSLIPDFDDNGQVKGYYGLITDISDRKRAEEASILEERNRMAREIHDTLAQAFTGILVHMGTVSRLVATNPQAIQTHINTVRDLARTGLTEARRSVAALRPQSLEDGNLWTALQRFVVTMQSSTETSLICDIIGTPYTLPPETDNNLLRIAQEAFTNSIRYANANEIRIELIYEPTQFFLRIKDNGQGFEANHTTLNRGFGLLGITERAERIGAQLSIESRLGQGTETSVSVHREASA
ncbi:AAA family ATPase [Nostoc sp. UCD121]|uniref:AAA family ATPase n=1 Tax=unclassified Nostoc TaxID=2593658 RepID=UPI001624F917|nr:MULTISPECIES: AAA family ATPase [unclassified Nostoc]MBC1224471.1 AAA family ATPase [Nostoc sp. UCD120]MBC1278735.1 AAA family ATPase [Nostoc sp. UCD121]MBC1296994.1 AAA family ATPase [Nostoc sp. UCD122]